jgi:hypothetical protein
VPLDEALECAWCVAEELPALQDQYAAMEAMYLQEIDTLEKDLDKTLGILADTRNDLLTLTVEPPSFFDSPYFWGGLMLVLGTTATIAYYELKGN